MCELQYSVRISKPERLCTGKSAMILFRDRNFSLRQQFQTNSATIKPSIQSVRGPFHRERNRRSKELTVHLYPVPRLGTWSYTSNLIQVSLSTGIALHLRLHLPGNKSFYVYEVLTVKFIHQGLLDSPWVQILRFNLCSILIKMYN
jgi:hypothetical protein